MKHRVYFTYFPLFAIFLLITSCGDDPELVKKREAQKAVIARLEGEVALLNEKLNAFPPDRSAQLEEAKKKNDAQTAELARLETEVIALESQKKMLEKDFANYKSKYPLTR